MREIILNSSGYRISIQLAEDGKSGTILSDMHTGIDSDEHTAAYNAIESLVLAHACAGVNVQSEAYMAGLSTAIEAIDNYY
jgi:hypothetical protein